MKLLDGLEILQLDAHAPQVSLEAVDFAGQMAVRMGARVLTSVAFEADATFLGRDKSLDREATRDPIGWASQEQNRILLVAGGELNPEDYAGVAAVLLNADEQDSEATWFASSGIADLLGDPTRAPIIPSGHYAAGTTGYGVFCALCALSTKLQRYQEPDVAVLDGAGVLAWVNWKAAATAELGGDLQREGENAEWPVLPCLDGYVALVFQERDWPAIVRMVGDARLASEDFRSFRRRAANRDEYMSIIRSWAAKVSKKDLFELFAAHEIPAAPVMDEADLLEDPLLDHREAFVDATTTEGTACRSPRLAHRIVHVEGACEVEQVAPDSTLPLAGIRVLDLGIITAGAGVGGLLADLGAEVLKIESLSYPDPFRQWAGEAVSPLFKCNNRNKYGIAIDLKTDDGREQFSELVRTADLVLENFRRGVLDRLGFDYAALKAINPQIVLASISGQGLDGPGSEATSFGSTLEASSGFSANVHYEDGSPYITGRNLNYPDQTVVLYAAAVLTAALADRSYGMQLDVSQRDVAVFLSGEVIEQITAGRSLTRQPNGACYAASDGVWIASAHEESIDGQPISEWIASRSSDEVLRELARKGVSAEAVYSGGRVLERFELSGQFARSPSGDLVKGFPFQLSVSPMKINLDSPEVGEHTAQFLEGA